MHSKIENIGWLTQFFLNTTPTSRNKQINKAKQNNIKKKKKTKEAWKMENEMEHFVKIVTG